MSTVAVRASNRLADMLDWLEAGPSSVLRDTDRFIRVEDFTRDHDYVVRAEIPGVDPAKDIELTLEDGQLTIHGERREETQEKNRSEFRYGSFTRTLRLPRGTDPDQIAATYQDGILEVTVPMVEQHEAPAHIPVKRTES